jgi:hypothetical protein
MSESHLKDIFMVWSIFLTVDMIKIEEMKPVIGMEVQKANELERLNELPLTKVQNRNSLINPLQHAEGKRRHQLGVNFMHIV